MLRQLINLFLPNECAYCHQPLLKGERSLCLVCQSKLPRTHSDKPDNEAEHRVFGRVPFEHGASFCYYRKAGKYASLIINAKYLDHPWLNYDLASLFAAELAPSGWPFDIDIIIPIPIHPFRRLSRGYNQAEPIAEALSKAWGLPVEKGCLKKGVYTSSQTHHTALQRFEAMEGTFKIKHPERIKGKHVLLVDDVLTTGATLDSCSQLLMKVGARISFLTLGLSE